MIRVDHPGKILQSVGKALFSLYCGNIGAPGAMKCYEIHRDGSSPRRIDLGELVNAMEYSARGPVKRARNVRPSILANIGRPCFYRGHYWQH
eukprot:6182885-Pleurochrysis_carterae.AAC.6